MPLTPRERHILRETARESLMRSQLPVPTRTGGNGDYIRWDMPTAEYGFSTGDTIEVPEEEKVPNPYKIKLNETTVELVKDGKSYGLYFGDLGDTKSVVKVLLTEFEDLPVPQKIYLISLAYEYFYINKNDRDEFIGSHLNNSERDEIHNPVDEDNLSEDEV